MSLSSCDSPEIPKDEDVFFENEDVRNALNLSDSDKEQLAKSIISYGAKSEALIYDPDEIPDYNNYFSLFEGKGTTMNLFYTSETNLKFTCLGYEGDIVKNESSYISSGSYFELVSFFGEEFANDLAESLFNSFYFNHIFSFEIGNFLKILIDPNSNRDLLDIFGIDTDESYFKATTKISDLNWYKKIICKKDEGNGNFVLSTSNPVSIINEFQLTEDSPLIKEEYVYDLLDISYKNHLIDYFCLKQETYHYDENNVKIFDAVSFSYEKYFYNINSFEDLISK